MASGTGHRAGTPLSEDAGGEVTVMAVHSGSGAAADRRGAEDSSGIFYARRRKHSPALVLQAETVQALAALITEWEASR
jgi:hypothetical protein